MKYIFSVFLWIGISFSGLAMDDADEGVSRDEQENAPVLDKARKTRPPTIEALQKTKQSLQDLMHNMCKSQKQELLPPLTPEAQAEWENQVKKLVAQIIELLPFYYQDQLKFFADRVRLIETDPDQINLYNTFCKKHLQNNIFFYWCDCLALAKKLDGKLRIFFDQTIREAFGISEALMDIAVNFKSNSSLEAPEDFIIAEWVQLYWNLVDMDPEEGEDWCHSMNEHLKAMNEQVDLKSLIFDFSPFTISNLIKRPSFLLNEKQPLCQGSAIFSAHWTSYSGYVGHLCSMDIKNCNDQYLTTAYLFREKEFKEIFKKVILEGTDQQMKKLFLCQIHLDLVGIRDLINEPSEMHPLQILINDSKYNKVKLLLEWGADYTHESIDVGALWEILFGAHSAITLPEPLAAEIRAYLEDRLNLPMIEEVPLPLPMPTPSPTLTPNPFDSFDGGPMRAAFFGKGFF
jgi:hypothetical protein